MEGIGRNPCRPDGWIRFYPRSDIFGSLMLRMVDECTAAELTDQRSIRAHPAIVEKRDLEHTPLESVQVVLCSIRHS